MTANGAAIAAKDLPREVRDAPPAPRRAVSEGDEREQILEALRWADGHREKAAARLGVSRVTLWKRMKRLELTWP